MIPETLQAELALRVRNAVTAREAAVDIMKELQHHYGWLTDEAVQEASSLLGLSPLQIEELATFYEMIYRRPVGNHVIHVCDSISCWNMGGETLMRWFERQLGITAGGTTPDGLFTLLPCSCLGNCGNAPAVMVGDRQYGPVATDEVPTLLDRLRHQTDSP